MHVYVQAASLKLSCMLVVNLSVICDQQFLLPINVRAGRSQLAHNHAFYTLHTVKMIQTESKRSELRLS